MSFDILGFWDFYNISYKDDHELHLNTIIRMDFFNLQIIIHWTSFHVRCMNILVGLCQVAAQNLQV